MATAKKLPSGQWRVQVYSHTEIIDGKPKKIRESFTANTKKEAEFMAAEFALNKKRAVQSIITVEEALNNYVDSKENILSPSTHKLYRSFIRKYYTSIKHIAINKLTNNHIQKEINDLSKDMSPKSVHNIYGLLYSSLKASNPKMDIDVSLPKKQKREMNIPTSSEIASMLDYSKHLPLHTAIILGFSMGLRRGEIAGLKWSDINFDTKKMHVHTSVVLDDKKEWVFKEPKSYEGNRILDIPDIAYEELKRIYSDDTEAVFPFRPSAISNSFIRMTKDLNLEHIRFHDLRHYYASLMLAANVPDKYAMQRMGHATNAVLKNVYQHLIDEKDREVTENINAHLLAQFSEKSSHESSHNKK